MLHDTFACDALAPDSFINLLAIGHKANANFLFAHFLQRHFFNDFAISSASKTLNNNDIINQRDGNVNSKEAGDDHHRSRKEEDDEEEEENVMVKSERSFAVLVSARWRFRQGVGQFFRSKFGRDLGKFFSTFLCEEIDLWSNPIAFFAARDGDSVRDDDECEKQTQRASEDERNRANENEEEEGVFSFRLNERDARRADGCFDDADFANMDRLYERIVFSIDKIRKKNRLSEDSVCAIFIDSLDVLAARTSEKAVVRFLVRLRNNVRNIALVTGCSSIDDDYDNNNNDNSDDYDYDDKDDNDDDIERRQMHDIVESLADVTLIVTKLPSEGGNKGELMKVVTRHSSVDSKYLNRDFCVIASVDEENGKGNGYGNNSYSAFSKKEEGVRFSLTSEATAAISELGAKIERYNFNF